MSPQETTELQPGLRRWSVVAALLVGLWSALVIASSIVGALARSRHRPEAEPNRHLAPPG